MYKILSEREGERESVCACVKKTFVSVLSLIWGFLYLVLSNYEHKILEKKKIKNEKKMKSYWR